MCGVELRHVLLTHAGKSCLGDLASRDGCEDHHDKLDECLGKVMSFVFEQVWVATSVALRLWPLEAHWPPTRGVVADVCMTRLPACRQVSWPIGACNAGRLERKRSNAGGISMASTCMRRLMIVKPANTMLTHS